MSKEKNRIKMRFSTSILIVIIANSVIFAQRIIPPVLKHKTSFAIIIDNKTFEQTDSAVYAYRNAIENDGLSVYILIKDWKNPDDVKKAITKLYETSANLEGVVLVGDIPVTMILNAPHLTSSYKMNRSTSFISASVASDRFYDDFDLKFKFLKQDRTNPLNFYYSLLPESTQRIEKEIYSARIIPPVTDSTKYQRISDYLFKVVEQKKTRNKLDNMFVFTGYGYHSESLSSWADEQLVLREELPGLFKPGGRLKKIEYSMDKEIKDVVLNEIQSPDLDFAIFHAHGDNNVQYLLDEVKTTEIEDEVAKIKLNLRERLRSNSKKEDIKKTKSYYKKYFGIPERWFSGAFSDSVQRLDYLNELNKNIYSRDIQFISPQAKLIFFDQCSSGSFHMGSYIVGEYVFGKGEVISAFANTAATLQDQWADEYIGLLDYGLRIGQLHKMNVLLESHVIGDPTFRFSSDFERNINELVVLEKNNILLWNEFLNSGSVPLRTLGLYMLFKKMGSNLESEMVKIYNADESFSVRLEVLKNLAELNTNIFENILLESLVDPFEYIRRVTAIWMGKVGKKEFLPFMAKQLLTDESERVIFNLKRSMIFIDPEDAYKECMNYLDKMPTVINKNALKEIFKISLLNTGNNIKEEILASIKNDDLRLRRKIKEVKTLRNYNLQPVLPELMDIAKNKNEVPELRIAVLEVLGWYGFSYNREIIVITCDDIISDNDTFQNVKDEALKTKKRILEGFNNPFTS